ncbi:MAG: hypothetical protein H3C27_04795 [Opitutaceae bacterium]|nr:hypothetical protein [Opitutaceae bacterium]
MAQSSDALADFRPETVRGRPGFFRVARTTTGQWWFIDPDGHPFFVKAVHGVTATESTPHDPAARLRRWGFNALGGGGETLQAEEALPFLATVDFCAAGSPLHLAGVRLPDVFDPDWRRHARERAAERCGPAAENPLVLGWLTDEAAGWSPRPAADRPGLLQVCLSLEPGLAAYHAAWEFALALHQGRLEALARAWGTPLANKEALRVLTRAEQGITTRGYLQDDARWTREFARRYFTTAAAAVREFAPNHLVLGCRWRGPAGPALLAACAEAADVCLIDHTELPAVPSGPVLLGDFNWVQESFWSAPPVRRGVGPTSLERMLRRGRLVLTRAAAHPAVAGYVWHRWRDRPGEAPPFGGGLVHADETEAREHTELLTLINDRVEELRAMATNAETNA